MVRESLAKWTWFRPVALGKRKYGHVDDLDISNQRIEGEDRPRWRMKHFIYESM
jgi:hypothetical protein